MRDIVDVPLLRDLRQRDVRLFGRALDLREAASRWLTYIPAVFPTDTHMQSAARFTLLRSATNPDGSASVTQRVFAITGEILPDGRCRATVAQAAA